MKGRTKFGKVGQTKSHAARMRFLSGWVRLLYSRSELARSTCKGKRNNTLPTKRGILGKWRRERKSNVRAREETRETPGLPDDFSRSCAGGSIYAASQSSSEESRGGTQTREGQKASLSLS